MIDITTQIDAINRLVDRKPADSGEVVAVLLTRSYSSPVEDVRDAVTNPSRIRRWFMPASGNLREGGASSLRAMPTAESCAASRRACCGQPLAPRRASSRCA
jgi:hypothetical protein